MPEEVGRATSSAQKHSRQAEEPSKTTTAPHPAFTSQEQREAIIKWVTRIGVAGVTIIGLLNVFLFFQTGAWQMLAVAIGETLVIVCLVAASRMARRGKLNAAGYWIMFSLTFAFAAAELVQAGTTTYFAIGGVLIVFVAGSLVLPRRFAFWLVTTILLTVCIWLINQFEPLPRYDVGTLTVLRAFLMCIVALLAMAALWRLFYFWQNIVTIRIRLLTAFVLVALLPVVAISIGAAVSGQQRDRQNALARLESLAEIKESQINNWVQDLQTQLVTALNSEEIWVHTPTLLQADSSPQARSASHRTLQNHLRLLVKQSPLIEELFLMNLQGEVILSSNSEQEGRVYQGVAFFEQGLEGPHVSSPAYSTSLGQVVVVAVRPLVGTEGRLLGVLAGRANLTGLNEIILDRTGLGTTGEACLIDSNYALLTALRYCEEGNPIHTLGAERALENHSNGSGVYAGYLGETVLGVYRWLPELQIALLVEQNRAEALAPTYTTIGIIGGIALLSMLFAVVTALFLTRSIANPIKEIADKATQIADGDLEQTVKGKRGDEIGSLIQAFNSMTIQLKDSISNLEQLVSDRTYELERRSSYLEASAEIGRTASSILDVDRLIQQVIELIRGRFGLYYVGLFTVDEAGEWAVLQAGTGEAGKAMLRRGHRIRIGQGMIGWSIAHAQARVAAEAGEDAVRLVTAELPDTRSEAAIPLRSRGEVIGALTVQSDQVGAFDKDALLALQAMADQVAIALDNAHLFAESRAAVEASSRAYGELSREAWGRLLRAAPKPGYRSSARGVTGAADIWRPEMEQALQEGQLVQGNGADSQTRTPLAVPIKVRGNVIGVLDTYKSTKDGMWTSEEIALLETLAEQLGVALESGRLYHEAQRRAARERLTREITEKMRRAADVESIVQTAVDELFSVLGTSRAFVRLGAIPPAEDNADIEPASVDIEPASVDIEPASVSEPAPADSEPSSVSEPAPADSEPSSAEKSDER